MNHIEEITHYEPHLLPIIQGLLSQLSASAAPLQEEDFRLLINTPDSHLFVFFEEEAIVGMMTLATFLSPTGRKWWIEDVVVDAAQRGKGFGSLLVRHAQQFVEHHGGGWLYLTSRPARVAANQLYIKMGFERKDTNVYRMKF